MQINQPYKSLLVIPLPDGEKIHDQDKVYVLLNFVIFFQIGFKCCKFFYVSDTFGMMSQLLLGVVKAVMPFLGIFIYFVLFFAASAAILGGNQ